MIESHTANLFVLQVRRLAIYSFFASRRSFRLRLGARKRLSHSSGVLSKVERSAI